MQQVEQALFTSLDTDCAAGYHVVARSPGVCDADARELAVWGPTHDSVLELNAETESFNFHPLPSGAHCISRTVSAAGCRNGAPRVATQCLVVPPEVLTRFGNNPFALIHAAAAGGAWQARSFRGPTLDPLPLSGGATPVDQPLLGRLAVDPGPENMAALVQAAREAVCLVVSGTRSAAELIAGLFSCLPPECRLEFSFSTGLKFSPRRPFRIVTLSDDPAERQWIAHYPNVALLELRAGELPPPMLIDGWSRLIQRTLATGEIGFLAAQASKRRFHLTPDDLPALGLQLLEELDASEFDDPEAVDEAPWCDNPRSEQQAHAAHRQFAKSGEAAPTVARPAAAPSLGLHPQSPAVLEKLEHLDDLVYETISGRSDTIEQLQTAWPKLVAELGEPLLAESREQYLRYALSIWEDCVTTDGIRDPSKAIQALDVLSILFSDAM